MQSAYTTARIMTEQVDAAHLLVAPLAPQADIDCWRSYCKDVISGVDTAGARHEIVVASNPRGHLKGLCVRAVVGHPVQGVILDVPVFVVASAADEMGVAAALLCDLRLAAGRLDCAAIRIRTEGSQRLHRHLENSGRTACVRPVALILDPRPSPRMPWAPPQDDGLPVKT